jgi:hypothetical protein
MTDIRNEPQTDPLARPFAARRDRYDRQGRLATVAEIDGEAP